MNSANPEGTQTDNTLRLLAICGIVAPILFITMVITLGLLRPGYDPVTQFQSELGATGTQNAIFMDINFVLVGILIVAFALGLHRGISKGVGSKTGPALLAINGAFGGAQGIFPADPGEKVVSFSGNMHNLVGLISLIAFILGLLVIARRLKNDPLWQDYRSYTRITGFVMLGVFVGGFLFLFLLPWHGLTQRLLFLIPAAWAEVMAIRLLRLSTTQVPLSRLQVSQQI